MKKIIFLAAAAIFASVSAFAQDLDGATDMYNSGVVAYQEGDTATALECFQTALTMAEFCGADGADIVANCKNAIPSLVLSAAKKAASENNYDEAVAKAKEAAEIAGKYGNADVKAQAEELIPQLSLGKANALLQAKDYEAAATAYQAVVETNPENGAAWLRLGSCYTATGKNDEAIDAFKKANDCGEAAAAKQLSNLYLKEAQNNLKAQKYAEVIANCVESNAYSENGNAYKLAASAATKLQKNTDAVGYYEKYLELTPDAKDAADITYTIAVLSQQAGDKTKALQYYKKIENDPKYKDAAQAQIKALQ